MTPKSSRSGGGGGGEGGGGVSVGQHHDPLGDADMKNAHLALVSRIHRLTTTTSDPSTALRQIKMLINNSGTLEFGARAINNNRSSLLPVPPLISTGPSLHDGSLSPPMTNPDSLSDSLYLSEMDLASPSARSSSRRSRSRSTKDMNDSEANMTAFEEVQQPAKREKNSLPQERSDGGDDSGTKEDEDDEEFTLEEELAGIADAPPSERAAMRRALREKQLALGKQMREAAADKQRIAVEEARRIKQTLFGGETEATPRSNPWRDQQGQPLPDVQLHDQNDQPVQATQSHSQPKATPILKHVADGGQSIKKDKHSTAQPSMVETLVLINDSDEDDTDQSSPIICLDAIAPKKTSHFGIAFDPSKLDEATADHISGTAGSKDTRRSVLVQCIPPETTVHELLAYICGGTVVSAKLVPDPKNAGNSQVAMVTFATAKEAHACIELSASILGRSELASKLRVSLLPTASYPTGDVLPTTTLGYLGLSAAEQPTRCLSVDNYPKYLINELCTELHLNTSRLPDRMHVLEEMWFAHDTLYIHFTSISEAKKAHGILTFLHFGRYRNDVHYAADPCASTRLDVSATGAVKLASHGHQGLKSLLQTVGLASYARNQEKLYAEKINSARTARVTAAPPVVPVQSKAWTPTWTPKSSRASMTSDTASLLMSLDSGMCGASSEPLLVGSRAEGCAAVDSSPWTDTLMAGLDQL